MNEMTDEQKSQEIAAKYCEYYDGSKEAESTSYNSAMEMARYKDNQQISELGGWQTEPPTKDCTVLLYITEQTLTVSRWNSPNKMFYNEYLEPIKHWLKWKLI